MGAHRVGEKPLIARPNLNREWTPIYANKRIERIDSAEQPMSLTPNLMQIRVY
jgi:hypothetical protein